MNVALVTQWIRPPYGLFGVLVSLLSPGPAQAADVTGYVVLTSDYVYRGVTYSDGHIAGQTGADIAFDSGAYAGVWGSTVDIQNGPSRQRDRQVSYYVGYGHDLNSDWSVGASIVAYTFPGSSGNVSYNFEEYSVSANYRDRAWLEYSFSPDLYGSGEETQNVELFAEWPARWQLTLGAGVGFYDVSALSGDGYAYWQIGLTRPVGKIDVDLRYHDTSRWVPIVSSPERADARLSLSARFQF